MLNLQMYLKKKMPEPSNTIISVWKGQYPGEQSLW